jgi:hypothetical protein
MYTLWRQSAHRHNSFLFSIPNEGKASYGEAQRLKMMGLTSGIPDLCLIISNGVAHFCEVKTPTGKVTPNQEAIHTKLQAITGTAPTIVRTLAQFEEWLNMVNSTQN